MATIPSREQIEATIEAKCTQGIETDLVTLEDTTRIFLNLEVTPGAVQEFSTTPTLLTVFKAAPETSEPKGRMVGGATAGYPGLIKFPVGCYALVGATLSFSQASGFARQFYYDVYKNGVLMTKAGGPLVTSGVETVSPVLTIDRYEAGDEIGIYGYVDAGTFNVTFTAGHFLALRVR